MKNMTIIFALTLFTFTYVIPAAQKKTNVNKKITKKQSQAQKKSRKQTKTTQKKEPQANQLKSTSGLTQEEFENLSDPLATSTQPTRSPNSPMPGQKSMGQTLRSQQVQQTQPTTNQSGLTKEEYDILSRPLEAPMQPTRSPNTPMPGQKSMAQTLRPQQKQQQIPQPIESQANQFYGISGLTDEERAALQGAL